MGKLHPRRGKSFYSPRQRRLEDIPVLPIHIMGAYLYYLAILDIISGREKSIAPFHIGLTDHAEIPATPLANPATNLSSHHILRLYDTDEPFTVDLLIRDQDLYFVAFRVGEADQWSVWFCFRNAVLPDFLPSEKFDMPFDYGQSNDCKPGGSRLAMSHMFHTFYEFSVDRVVDKQFKRAVFSVIAFFCEARRLRSMRALMSSRIENQTGPAELEKPYWDKINDWSSFGDVAVKAHKYHIEDPATPIPQTLLNKHGDLRTLGDLIADGELLVIKFKEEHLFPEWEEKQIKTMLAQRATSNVAEPRFDIPPPPKDGEGPHPGH